MLLDAAWCCLILWVEVMGKSCNDTWCIRFIDKVRILACQQCLMPFFSSSMLYHFPLHFLNISKYCQQVKFSEYNFLQTLGENYWKILFALESGKRQKEIDPCLLSKFRKCWRKKILKTFLLSANMCHLHSAAQYPEINQSSLQMQNMTNVTLKVKKVKSIKISVLLFHLNMRHLINLCDAEISLFSLCNNVTEETDVILDLVSAKNENIAPSNFGMHQQCYVTFGKGPGELCCICYQRKCGASKSFCQHPDKRTPLAPLHNYVGFRYIMNEDNS